MQITYIVKICLMGKESTREFKSKTDLMVWLGILIDNDVSFEVDMLS